MLWVIQCTIGAERLQDLLIKLDTWLRLVETIKIEFLFGEINELQRFVYLIPMHRKLAIHLEHYLPGSMYPYLPSHNSDYQRKTALYVQRAPTTINTLQELSEKVSAMIDTETFNVGMVVVYPYRLDCRNSYLLQHLHAALNGTTWSNGARVCLSLTVEEAEPSYSYSITPFSRS